MPNANTPSETPEALTGAALLLDNQLCFALYSTSLAMTKLYKPLLTALNLTYPQYLVLLVLWETDGITVSDLGQRLYLDSGTLTPLLKRMEQSGLLQRTRSTADERRVEVTLTAEGRALRQRAAAVPACMVQAAACPVADIQNLTRQVQDLRQRLTSHR